jgi:hypothetical protein
LERTHEANTQQVGTGNRWRIFWGGYMRPKGKRWAQAPGGGHFESIHEASSQQVGTGLRWRLFLRRYMRPIVHRWAQAPGGGYFGEDT